MDGVTNSDQDVSWSPPSLIDEESRDHLVYGTNDDSDSASDSVAVLHSPKRRKKDRIDSSDDGIVDAKLSWARLPSFEETSWQIDIKFHGNTDVKSYNVHPQIIAHQSTYFRSIFHDHSEFAESKVKRSFVDFGEDLLLFEIGQDAFEMFLDFLYCRTKHSYQLSPWNIIPFLFLSDYFGVDEFRERAIWKVAYCFYDQGANSLIAELYVFAERLSMNDLKVKVEILCYWNIRSHLPIIWENIPRDLKRSLFNGLRRFRKHHVKLIFLIPIHKHQPYFIQYVMERDPELIDAPLFNDILLDMFEERSVMDKFFRLHEDTALVYLRHEQRLGLDAPETDALTPLQEECIQTFSQSKSPKQVMIALKKLKPSIARVIMFNCIEKDC